MILKLLEVVVLKFKTIAKYQVTHLLENSNKNEVSGEKSKDKSDENSQMDTEKVDENKKTQAVKLDIFLSSFEDKDRVKVSLKYNNKKLTTCKFI